MQISPNHLSRIQRTGQHPGRGGFVLMTVLGMVAVAMLVLGGALSWSSQKAFLNKRASENSRNKAIVDAVHAETISKVSGDYLSGGVSLVEANLSKYGLRSFRRLMGLRRLTGDERDFEISVGLLSRSKVERNGSRKYMDLSSKGMDHHGYATSWNVISTTDSLNNGHRGKISSIQEITLAEVPVFQFGVFYGLDLEFTPYRKNLTIKGKVHSNGDIYVAPHEGRVTFKEAVSASGKVMASKHPGDPVERSEGRASFRTDVIGGVTALSPVNLGSGRNAMHALIEPQVVSRFGGSGSSDGYMAKADLVITVTDAGVVIGSGSLSEVSVSIPWSEEELDEDKGKPEWAGLGGKKDTPPAWGKDDTPDKGKGAPADKGKGAKDPPGKDQGKKKDKEKKEEDLFTMSDSGILRTDLDFFDKRENRRVVGTEIDVSKLVEHYDDLTKALGRAPKLIYLNDTRRSHWRVLTVVRVVNGETLPASGLTVATSNPMYVKGNFNAPKGGRRSRGGKVVPASLVADAITIVSDRWKDEVSYQGLSSRKAEDTTINAAIVTGIVPTRYGFSSGGGENSFRLLEDWGRARLLFTGSIVVLYESEIATTPWGLTDQVYKEPRQRLFNADPRFVLEAGQPPGAPTLRVVLCGESVPYVRSTGE